MAGNIGAKPTPLPATFWFGDINAILSLKKDPGLIGLDGTWRDEHRVRRMPIFMYFGSELAGHRDFREALIAALDKWHEKYTNGMLPSRFSSLTDEEKLDVLSRFRSSAEQPSPSTAPTAP